MKGGRGPSPRPTPLPRVRGRRGGQPPQDPRPDHVPPPASCRSSLPHPGDRVLGAVLTPLVTGLLGGGVLPAFLRAAGRLRSGWGSRGLERRWTQGPGWRGGDSEGAGGGRGSLVSAMLPPPPLSIPGPGAGFHCQTLALRPLSTAQPEHALSRRPRPSTSPLLLPVLPQSPPSPNKLSHAKPGPLTPGRCSRLLS